MKPRTTAYLYLLLVSVIWGAASPVVKYTLNWFDPWLFLTYRFFISSAIAFPYLVATNTRFPKKPLDAGLVLLTGFVSAPLALFLFFEALTKTTALSGSLLTSVGPLMAIAGGAFLFHDRITRFERIGIAITILGAATTAIGPLIINGQMDSIGNLEGNLIMLGAVTVDIAALLLSEEALKRRISPALLGHSQFIIGMVIFIPILLSRQTLPSVVNTIALAPIGAHLGVLFMAVLSGTIAYTLRNIAIKTVEVSESALFHYLQPIWAAILAVLWLGETITRSYIVGGVVIAAGVVVAEYRRTHRQARR